MGKKLKYMGSADVRILKSGEDFGGRLGAPLTQDVEWNTQNRHVVDTDEVGLSDAAVTLLTDNADEFVDVTGLDTIPLGLNQRVFQSLSDGETVDNIPAPEVTAPGTPSAASRNRAGTTTTVQLSDTTTETP